MHKHRRLAGTLTEKKNKEIESDLLHHYNLVNKSHENLSDFYNTFF